ncbi:Alpha-N-acetylglucosaminidase [Papilio xuthus]|uniref:Alpha-N-acetylglucosaminidase n=1 Tax=Papilio xuthus TaxID=66420 RepID=A0A194PY25_PAPXU|nr:Alpha-N-acetylglucosaminidase [Papilio xuthus]
MKLLVFFVYLKLCYIAALNLDYLDPTVLQTKTSSQVQQDAATNIINKYTRQVSVTVDPLLFNNKKDVFALRTSDGCLQIRASSGVAALWGFNYYLKKYCKSQIAWQTQRITIPETLPEVNEVVVASDRFRYYQNVCTASYSFVWWTPDQWLTHVEWMALNGINLALAPIAQEAAWDRIYRKLGMTDEEINEYFTGPAFLSWLRMGNVHGWGGPLTKSWHERQQNIQDSVVSYMFKLGIIPVFPAFNGHVPSAFTRLYPKVTFYSVEKWNKFSPDYCCGLFINPREPLFTQIGEMFLREMNSGLGVGDIFAADPFNEIQVQPWSTSLVRDTASAVFSAISKFNNNAVWLVQNWMFVHNPVQWPLKRVQSFLTAVPEGRMLVLDLQSEQWPQYNLYQMYYGQPFIWCMLHNFGGTLGMFGNMQAINKDVYLARDIANSTMIGIGLTPEGINQNYVMYDLMLEVAWRKEPIQNLDNWVADYAERRYGCNTTSSAWKYLLKSVYNFSGLNPIRGKYVVTRRPSFRIRPWAWYKSSDLFNAFKEFVLSTNSGCNSDGFYYDLVDVTRQALQYRADQLYLDVLNQRFLNLMAFNATIGRFIDLMNDMENILATNNKFMLGNWLAAARSMSDDNTFLYELNARNQITLWGPNGEISDYACKQWAELFHYYYTPRWSLFLSMALDAKARNEFFDESSAQKVVRSVVEEKFLTVTINPLQSNDTKTVAFYMYEKWGFVSGLEDLPLSIVRPNPSRRTTLSDLDSAEREVDLPTVIHWHSTTPTD